MMLPLGNVAINFGGCSTQPEPASSFTGGSIWKTWTSSRNMTACATYSLPLNGNGGEECIWYLQLDRVRCRSRALAKAA
uniref:Uncharacterized protein n=1 Tax=Arundo donax TaxID=35708 RepID=A0A0A8ZCR7_ARUDO